MKLLRLNAEKKIRDEPKLLFRFHFVSSTLLTKKKLYKKMVLIIPRMIRSRYFVFVCSCLAFLPFLYAALPQK